MEPNQPKTKRTRLSHVDILLFTKYLSVLLNSGLPIDEALQIIDQSAKGDFKKIIDTLSNSVRTGKTLADGMAEYPRSFSTVYVNLIRAGESSGSLQKNLDQLSLQLQKEHELSSKIRGAMMYPAVILTAGVLITAGIFVFILPSINGIFASLDVELPLPTRVMLWISDTIQAHGTVILPSAIVGAWILSRILRLKAVKPLTHRIILRLPVIGALSQKSNLARFTRLMGTLLLSGIPIQEALGISETVLRNVRYRELFRQVHEEVVRGKTLSSLLELHPRLVPPMALRLIRVGEETGTLGEMFTYLANFYEVEVDDATRNLPALLEPLLIVGIGAMVAGLALAILTPIYKIVGSV
ncbi:MAG: type II secretion system F family protein [Candidatus Uhrbacteria bacterium]